MTIGFFDSGIGGVSVLAEALERLPGQAWLFDADVDHVPYGEKSADQIAHYARENARFLLSEGAEAIVVACNTATAVAIEALRAELSVPVIGMEPAVKPAVEELSRMPGAMSGALGELRAESAGAQAPGAAGHGRVLVAATPVTLREAKLAHLIDRVDSMHRVDLLPLPGLVPLAERECFDGDEAEAYLTEALADVDPERYGAFVLGCTHFLYFKPLFHRLLGDDIRLIDGNGGTVRRLASVLGLPVRENGVPADTFDRESAEGHIRWFRSGRQVTEPAEIQYFERFLARAKKIKNL